MGGRVRDRGWQQSDRGWQQSDRGAGRSMWRQRLSLGAGSGAGCGLRRPAKPTRFASLWRSGAERADYPAVLVLAPALRNSLRARWALRSDKRNENDDERASRWAQALRSSAPQSRVAYGLRSPSQPDLWLALRQRQSL